MCRGQFRTCRLARGGSIEVEPEQRDAEPGDEYGENQKLDGLVVVQSESNADDTHGHQDLQRNCGEKD
ncbi:hypothetical protein EN35_17440 [Rhodococcus qingshengii]|nr:hypothetical protein EN35_17440 [Rhodococcus qingshengii]